MSLEHPTRDSSASSAKAAADHFGWLGGLNKAMASQKTPQAIAEAALSQICLSMAVQNAVIVAANTHGLTNESVQGRMLVLAAKGRLQCADTAATLPPSIASCLEAGLAGANGSLRAGYLLHFDTTANGERLGILLETQSELAQGPMRAAMDLLMLHIGNRVLSNQAPLEPITGLVSFRAGLQLLRNTLLLSTRTAQLTTAVRFQIDNYEELRWSYGVSAGHVVLRGLARATRKACRRTDTLIQMDSSGGFLLVLPATPLKGGLQMADSLRNYLSAVQFDFDGIEVSCTISVGVGTAEVGMTDAMHLLRRTSDAMHAAREAGGNQVNTAKLH